MQVGLWFDTFSDYLNFRYFNENVSRRSNLFRFQIIKNFWRKFPEKTEI